MTFSSFFKKLTLEANSRWTALEIFLLSLCLILPKEAGAHILVYKLSTNQLFEEYNDMPAQFGPSLPPNGIKVFAIPAFPTKACKEIHGPPASSYPPNTKFVAIVERGGENCSFELKVRNAQVARFDAVVVFNNKGDDLETMSATNSSGIWIPSVFVGHTTGLSLISFYTDEIVIIINDELPFNINTQLILPFSILIGLCFLTMIFYMIYKCIRERRRTRRNRLPKRMLKRLRILKYTKNSNITQDTCVICIEDYVEGDKLRMLPCRHVYHTHCIDHWLTEIRRVCPMCKRKVFTNRNRQSSMDSVTDTDDDTTPLLQPAPNNNNATHDGDRRGRGRRNRSRAEQGATATSDPQRRNADDEAASAVVRDFAVSDDENVLLAQQSPMHNTRRVNPFDRMPNLPPHLAEQLNQSNQDSRWYYNIIRLFRRQQPISVAAPPYEGEFPSDNHQQGHISHTPIISIQQQSQSNATIVMSMSTPPAPPPVSNNILNPNLSGSFKDDDEIPHQSIYEPIVTPVTLTSNNPAIQDGDSIFIQTPVQGSIGVVALPNNAFADDPRGAASSSTRRNDPRFLV